MEPILIILLAVMSTALPLWLGRRYGVLPLVSPMHFLGYFCVAGFLVKAVVYPLAPDWAFYQRFIEAEGADVIGALYLTAFVMMMCFGYRAAIRVNDIRRVPIAAKGIATGLAHRNTLFLLAFLVAGLTVVLLLRARGASGLSLDLLQTLNTDKQIEVDADGVGSTLAGIKTLFVIPKCAFVLLFAHGIARHDRVSLFQAAAIAGLLVFTALISGDRFELVELLAYGAITFLMVGGQARLWSVILALCSATVVLLLSAYMTALRGNDAGLLHQIVGSTYFLDFNASIMVTDRVTPQTYLWGESYTWWGFGWVPRAIWVEKPAVDLGVFFKHEVMGIATGGAFNVTGPGEAFINFGWAGISVGFVLGWVYRRVEIGLLRARTVQRHASVFYYPLVFYPFVQATLQSSFSAFIVGAAAQLVLIAGVLVSLVPRRQQTPLPLRGYVYDF